MTLRKITDGVYILSGLIVNLYFIQAGNEIVLVDTGMPGNDRLILQALKQLGKQPQDLTGILITHLHRDHTGGLAALQRATGAPVYMGKADAELLKEGICMRPVEAAPGGLNRLVRRMMPADEQSDRVEPVEVEYMVNEGVLLPLAGGIRAIHTPGHTAGHTAYLWLEAGGVLFAGDVASRMFGGLRYSFIYEDFRQGLESLRKIAALKFDVLCLSHGRPIIGEASLNFRRRLEQIQAL